jgi:hypothetical protein
MYHIFTKFSFRQCFDSAYFREKSHISSPIYNVLQKFTCIPIFHTAFLLLKGQCHELFCFWFFHKSVFPQPQSVLLRPFRIFSKIRGDIRKSFGAPPVSTTPVANLPPVSMTDS